eukprot:12359719-Alexandrium_andersonii.AAC.1
MLVAGRAAPEVPSGGPSALPAGSSGFQKFRAASSWRPSGEPPESLWRTSGDLPESAPEALLGGSGGRSPPGKVSGSCPEALQ